MYSGDTTTICLGTKEEKIEVTSGIKQGCSISTLLFKLITYNIIEELEEKGIMYEVADYKGNSVWLADDTTLIANSKENMEKKYNDIERNSTEIWIGNKYKENKDTKNKGRGKL